MTKKSRNSFVSGDKIPELCNSLRAMQRQRVIVLKSRNMQLNRLVAVVADTLGYSASLSEKKRIEKYDEADRIIKEVNKGTASHPLETIIKVTTVGIDAFDKLKEDIEDRMVGFVKLLPISEWIQKPEQRGFKFLFLSIVIGETGDLCNYETPAKLWRRMSCAPHTFDNKTLMGATWSSKTEGKLPASEWEEYGYSPRRRSISFLIGKNMCMQNGNGPYRKRYDEAKAKVKAAHPEYPDLRCHRHGMLLASKLLLKKLWEEWQKQ